MTEAAMGKEYEDGEIIVRQGDTADCMFVIQEGEVEVLAGEPGDETRLRIAHEGEFLGEMAIFEHDVRSATVKAG